MAWFFLVIFLGLNSTDCVSAQDVDSLEDIGLEHLQSLRAPELKAPVDFVVAPDNAFVFVASWQSQAIGVYAWDADAEELKHHLWYEDTSLKVTLGLALSSDGKFLAAACTGTDSIVLFSVDDGNLTFECEYKSSNPSFSLDYPTKCAFSPDDKYLYVSEARGGGVLVLELTGEKKLKEIQGLTLVDGSLLEARDLTMSSDGKWIVVAAYKAHKIVVLARDADTGMLTFHREIALRDGLSCAAYPFGVVISPDDRFLYSVSGRFADRSYVGAMRLEANGNVGVIQQFNGGGTGLPNFRGGNKIVISPNGKHAFAAGTVSRSLAGFERNEKSGKLKLRGVHAGDTTGVESKKGPCAFTFLGDGKYLVVAVESNSSVEVYRVIEN